MHFKNILVFAALALPAVWAHHGTAASYDQKRNVKVKGVVKEFWWRNPHSALFIDGKDDAGKPVTYSIEMGSPNVMAKSGFRRDSFKPGDEVVVDMHPSFTNPSSGECLTCAVWINGVEKRLSETGN